MVGYKQIIKNMIEMYVEKYVEARTPDRQYCHMEDGTLKVKADAKSFDHPTFTGVFNVNYRRYEIHGFVGEFGDVVISSVNFDRDIMKDETRMDWYSEDNIEHKHYFLYGEELNDFKFDK